MITKSNVKYQETHEWVFVEGNKVKVGISSYAAMHLGDIVFFDLPKVGKNLSKGDVVAAVESVKSASDIYTPVSGTIVTVNEQLSTNPELVNIDPFNNWIVEIELSNAAELDSLMSVEKYEETL